MEHLEGLVLDGRYSYPYCFRDVIYLLCMKRDTILFRMDLVMNQPNPLISIEE